MQDRAVRRAGGYTMNISYFFCGSAIVGVPLDKAAELLNLCMYYGITYTDFKVCDDIVRLRFRLSSLKKLLPEAETRGICAQVISCSGIPVILSRYKHRYGIIVGFILAVALVFASWATRGSRLRIYARCLRIKALG